MNNVAMLWKKTILSYSFADDVSSVVSWERFSYFVHFSIEECLRFRGKIFVKFLVGWNSLRLTVFRCDESKGKFVIENAIKNEELNS